MYVLLLHDSMMQQTNQPVAEAIDTHVLCLTNQVIHDYDSPYAALLPACPPV